MFNKTRTYAFLGNIASFLLNIRHCLYFNFNFFPSFPSFHLTSYFPHFYLSYFQSSLSVSIIYFHVFYLFLHSFYLHFFFVCIFFPSLLSSFLCFLVHFVPFSQFVFYKLNVNIACLSWATQTKLRSVYLLHKQTTPTERPPHVGEVKSQLLRIEGVAWSAQRIPTAVNLDLLDPI
jgi:hypothetical protein